jgi:hypothetical protein
MKQPVRRKQEKPVQFFAMNPCDNGMDLVEGIQNHISYYNRRKHQTTHRKRDEAFIQSKAA